MALRTSSRKSEGCHIFLGDLNHRPSHPPEQLVASDVPKPHPPSPVIPVALAFDGDLLLWIGEVRAKDDTRGRLH